MFKPFLSVLTLSAILSGCTTTSPEYKAEKAASTAASSVNHLNTYKSIFDKLWPVCLAAIEKGEIPTDEQMKNLGYAKSLKTYKAKIDVVYAPNHKPVTIQFKAEKSGCFFRTNILGVQEGGNELARRLRAKGYIHKPHSSKPLFNQGDNFVKGEVTISLFGYSTTFSETTLNISVK